ncbi:hypothetical protein BD309DRAFT_850252 [Dichomitus squalens]|uniref:Uncharacterized protein n=1 Tax=Dichomitus squalens TaxID=114155 RepID=A0A4Q9P6A6_9APHY|nr:hypothetical protein BD311DRAFT_802022 [Dichomitus squalens]TBU49994.1 hypothetical protein BD309DRAFT_850252 [Dichomitus squalens]TBU62170.1 hypothetical protein BD310DRAFT_956610 [Dichomitus squalens]
MASTEAKNAAGLTPEESRNLKERSPEPHEQRIVQGIKELYSCKPQESTFDIYTKDAKFHDPVGIANGVDSIRQQFIGLVQLFPRAELPKFRVLENPPSVPKSTILIDQDVDYYRKPESSSATKRVNSLLTLETNEQHKVVRHTEEWDHRKTSSSEDGFLGMLNEHRKKLTVNITNMFTSKEIPK